MEEKKNIRELAVQYFEGRIRRKDEKLLFEYVGQSEANRTAFRQWEKEWIASGITDSNTTKEWETLQRKIRTQEAIIPMLGISKTRFSVWRKVAAVAAIVLLTVGGTLGVRQLSSSLQPETYFVCETPYGEKSKEGYFEVTKKAGATFIVQTHGYDIVVKGTKFDVSAYDDDPFISTTLLEGSVELNYKGSPIMMSPGESMRLDVETGKFIRTQVNASQSKAWAENRIEFDHITLKELVAKLSRQYDVNIRLESEAVGDKTFRISLRNRETIGEVMTALQEIIPITVERKGKDIYIRE